MYCAVVEHGALLRLQQVQREQLAPSAEGQNQRTPGRQLLLPRVNIGLQSEENSRETSDTHRDTHTQTHTLSLTHTHAHTLSHTHTHTHTLSLSLSLTHTARTHSLSHTHTHTHKHTHSLSHTHTLSLTHTHTHTHTRSLTHTLTHSQSFLQILDFKNSIITIKLYIVMILNLFLLRMISEQVLIKVMQDCESLSNQCIINPFCFT